MKPSPGAMKQSICLTYTATNRVHLLWGLGQYHWQNPMDIIPVSATM